MAVKIYGSNRIDLDSNTILNESSGVVTLTADEVNVGSDALVANADVLTAKAKPVGLFDIGECIYSETVSWPSNTSLSHNIGLTYAQISGGGVIYKFTFLGAMKILTDGISYTSLYAVYRHDYLGLLSFVESQGSVRHGATAGGQYNFGVTNPGANNGGSNVAVVGTLTGGGNANYQASVLILVHKIDTNKNYLT